MLPLYLQRLRVNPYKAGTNLVLLAPDVADAFPGEAAVNEALRLVMQLSKVPIANK
jgi:hypothetical protein